MLQQDSEITPEWRNRKPCTQCGIMPRTYYCKFKICDVDLSVIDLDLALNQAQKSALLSHVKYIDCF